MKGSTTRFRIYAMVILLVGAIAGFFAGVSFFPNSKISQTFAKYPVLRSFNTPFRLGLDLRGGTHLLYRADFSNYQGGSEADAMAGLRDVIERRVNLFGVTEPVVQVERAADEQRLIVELAGVKDIQEAIRLIGETPFLEFKEIRDASSTAAILADQKEGKRLNEDPYFIATELTGRFLARATLEFDPTTNAPTIGVAFNDQGGKLFEELTGRNIGNPLGIYLDGTPISLPNVNEKISGGRAQISGTFTVREAQNLVRRLNSGALPVPITLINQQSVDAFLGADSLQRSLVAALIGFLVVAFFMIVWYRLPGLVAVVALVIYAAFMLSLFKIIPVTITAAGIAGFVLSVGMAVDANILIFERTKEELRKGKELRSAIAEGFQRAWTSIRDSNISSLITAAILYWLGTSVVKGFALTLGIGILISMFSAISVSRTFLVAVAGNFISKHRALFLSGFARR